MNRSPSSRHRFLLVAVLFESGLGVAAYVLGRVVGSPPLATIRLDASRWPENAAALAIGIAAVVPLIAALVLMDRVPLAPLRDLRELVDTFLVPLFRPLSISQLLLVSLAAGIGEEMLFRGLLQAGLTRWIAPPFGAIAALSLASLAFGMCHWLTTTYAVLATLVGFYLGSLFLLTDNLLTPIATHAAYDFLALLYLVRRKWTRTPACDPP